MNTEDIRKSILGTLQQYAYSTPKGIYELRVTKGIVEEVATNLFRAMELNLIGGNSVMLPKLGMLKIKTNRARKARNPKTGEAFILPAHKKVYFQVNQAFKREIKKQ